MPKKEQVLFYPLPHVLYSQNWADPSEICSLRHGIILTRGEANPDPFLRMWQSFRPSAAAARRQQSGTTTSSGARQTPLQGCEQRAADATSSKFSKTARGKLGRDRSSRPPFFPTAMSFRSKAGNIWKMQAGTPPYPITSTKGLFPSSRDSKLPSHLSSHKTPRQQKINKKASLSYLLYPQHRLCSCWKPPSWARSRVVGIRKFSVKITK